MNNEEARFILQAYRPGGSDAGEALFAGALEQAKRDPGLGAWFAREQAHDAAVAAKLRTIAPPPGLRDAIMAGGRVTRQRPARWVMPAWIGLAASVAVIIAASLFWLQPAHADAQELPEFALNFAARPFRLTAHNDDLAELRTWLAARNAPVPLRIPANFAALHALGCRTVEYRGKDISLICFEQDREYHLFVARRADYPGLRECRQPEFSTKGNWAAAHWSDDENCYVLASDAGMESVRKLF